MTSERSGLLFRRQWKASVIPHWTTNVISALLIAVGISQAVIYVRQTQIMDAQANISEAANKQNEAVNRAFVYFVRLNVSFIPSSSIQNEWDAEGMAIWGNSGNTQTTHLHHVVACFGSRKPIAEPFKSIQWVTEFQSDVYAPRTTDNSSGLCNISSEVIKEINAKRTHFYFCGFVTYGDTLDRTALHRTEFCYELATIDRNTGRFTGTSVGKHNCADEECPPSSRLRN